MIHLSDDKWAFVCGMLLVAGIAVGWLLGHWRAYAECCDCCTCQTCTEEESDYAYVSGAGMRAGDSLRDASLPPALGSGAEVEATSRMERMEERRWSGNAGTYGGDHGGHRGDDSLTRRHTVVLEPGPTIYPALAELAGEVMGEPESHPDATTSPWLRLQLVDWERRYPIPVGAP